MWCYEIFESGKNIRKYIPKKKKEGSLTQQNKHTHVAFPGEYVRALHVFLHDALAILSQSNCKLALLRPTQ